MKKQIKISIEVRIFKINFKAMTYFSRNGKKVETMYIKRNFLGLFRVKNREKVNATPVEGLQRVQSDRQMR